MWRLCRVLNLVAIVVLLTMGAALGFEPTNAADGNAG